MKKYQAILSNNEINLLTKKVDRELRSIMSNSIHITLNKSSYQFYETVLFSFEDKTYLALNCEHLESDNLEDYWQISVKEKEYPEPLKYEFNSDFNSIVIDPHSNISFFSKIKGFSIFTKEIQTEREHLLYDNAILLYLEGNVTLCISAMRSCLGLDITIDEDKINETIVGCFVRYNIM
jgi:hypothetical protein